MTASGDRSMSRTDHQQHSAAPKPKKVSKAMRAYLERAMEHGKYVVQNMLYLVVGDMVRTLPGKS